MVQLSPSSPTGDDQIMQDIKNQSEQGLGSLQCSLSSAATPLQIYETYIENGSISLKHKIRNIEKKKVKLEDYRDRLNNGEALNPDQLDAVQKYEEVLHNLEFAKELQKTFSALGQDLIKAQKKSLRREHVQRLEEEKKRLCTVLEIQYLLQSFSQNHVQEDFKDGLNGAMFISSKELDYLSKFARLICHKRFKHMSLEDEMDQSSVYFWNLLEGSEKTVAGTSYKYLKDLIARMLDCGYFESVPDPPKKDPEVLIETPKTGILKVAKSELIREQESFVEYVKSDHRELSIRPVVLRVDQMRPTEVQKPEDLKCIKPEAVIAWPASTMVKLPEPKRWQTSAPLTALSKPWGGSTTIPQPAALPLKKCEPEPPKERRDRLQKMPPEIKPANQVKETKAHPVVNGQTPVKRDVPQPICVGHRSPTIINSQLPRILSQPAAEFCSSPTLPKDPELRKQRINDIIDEIKGTCNFMQDSVLDFEFPSPKGSLLLPPESPPKVITETLSMDEETTIEPQELSLSPVSMKMESDAVCPVVPEPADLPSDHQSPVRSHVNLPVSPVRELEEISAEQVSVTSPRLTEPPLERNMTPVNLPSSRIPSPKTPTNMSILQLQQEEAALSRSPPMSAHTSPFQGMPTVFKVSAPLPLRKEMEIEDPPYPAEYQQTFSTASTQTVPYGLLDTNGSDPHSLIQEPLSGPYSSSGASPVSSGNLPCYTSTPNILPRLSQPCQTRGTTIRGTSRGGRILTNGYRCQATFKGLESYRGAQCIPNGTYGHGTCPGRDFPVTQFISRDLCHKRGSVTSSTRTAARNWSDSQLGSPEREESFNSTDSGQGDSRSMTAVDMSMSNQAATILPVHVYPLPQQMRVAFSAARTSNFAPGTLDQPINFDLLLNNLGDTFDFQVGRFMCPVNGTYVFIFHMLKLAVNVPLYVNLMKNEEVMVSAYANDGAPDHETASNHAVLQLYQGDQIWLRLHRGAIYGSSWKYSTFSGYLLYQD